jgi:hypothetical protein
MKKLIFILLFIVSCDNPRHKTQQNSVQEKRKSDSVFKIEPINISSQSKINSTYVEGFFNNSLGKVKIRGLLIDDGTVPRYGDKQIEIAFIPYNDYVETVDTYVDVKIKTPSGKLLVIENVKLKYGSFYFIDWGVEKIHTQLKNILVDNGVYKFSITKGVNWEFELTLKNL